MNKVCVTITANDSASMIAQLKDLEKDHDFFELRLDTLDDLDPQTAEQVIDAVSSSVIATVRSKAEGGDFDGDSNEYRTLLEACYSSKADYVDIELAALSNDGTLAEVIQPNRTIVSYHNFDQTPSDSELEQIIVQMHSLAPGSIRKIACRALNLDDVFRLTELQKAQPKDQAIIIAMGEAGKVLRLLGSSIGAFTSFASADNSPAAPGQMYYREMKNILSAMEKK